MALKFSPAVIVPLPVLVLPLSVKRFANKLVPKVPKNIPRNPHFCSFGSFLIVSLTLFLKNPDSSRDYIHDIFHLFFRNY